MHSCPHDLAAVTEGNGQGDRTWERSKAPPKHCSSPERGTSHFWAVVSSGQPVVIPLNLQLDSGLYVSISMSHEPWEHQLQ